MKLDIIRWVLEKNSFSNHGSVRTAQPANSLHVNTRVLPRMSDRAKDVEIIY